MTSLPQETVLQWLIEELSRKTYSFVEYISHASPYIPQHLAPLWDLLLELRKEERAQADLLSRAIVEAGGIPTPMLLDESMADLNYLRLDYLVKLLIDHKKQAVARLEERVSKLEGYPTLRVVLLEILETEKSHIEKLRATLAECEQRREQSEKSSGASEAVNG